VLVQAVVMLTSGASWTLLTAHLMLFSVLRNPCSTTFWTIWSETRSLRWTAPVALLPLAIAFLALAAVTWTVRGLPLR
jgi:ferrous iron transport protein B